MTLNFLIYVVIGALLAWPAWKLTRALIYRTGLYKPKGRCFEAYVPAENLSLTNQSGANRV